VGTMRVGTTAARAAHALGLRGRCWAARALGRESASGMGRGRPRAQAAR
jgi:hypothetical protein